MYNNIIGTPFNDLLVGTAFDDLIVALQGDDRIIGSAGNDFIVGDTGIDTVDYSELGQAITLQATGIVQKGKVGTDTLNGIETIIGAKGQANTIDASTTTGSTTFVRVDLSANSLIVNGVPTIGTLNFRVERFVNVIGTAQNDSIIGDNNNNLLIGGQGNDEIFGLNGNDTIQGGAGDDVIGGGSKNSLATSRLGDGNDIVQGGAGNDILIGGTGNDTLDGGADFDTADYSNLGTAITLQAAGIVNKGVAGIDQILNIETIIGARGQANTIDGSTGTSTTTSFNVNLSTNSLVVNGVPVLGTLNFNVQNFVNVTGTSQADTIVGNNQGNLLIGGRGNDQISGLGGKDTIIGVDPNSLQPGINEVDTLTGGADPDKFVLGDAKNPYYVGGGGFAGLNDFALITDFQTGQDQIQLKKLDGYIFGSNYIAIASPFLFDSSKTFDDSVLVATANQIVKANGVYDASSQNLASSPIFAGFDVISIFSTSYSVSDIHFV
ncbi:hemolysin-type calcium-binding protein [Nostoc sp. CENA543]|uniref:calcium-binding protein n=1 Tax=Nostoc sp. CENA543 TaxID=1869241 RepID=UPI000CA3BD09|nr:calcium-binding protein [Nostoc sp. CENA543]AUT02166.1 hemolysin-type calcium-binding protein [Nostoc sp. CENA543]